ncbi:hypothetical protein RFI_05475, partial [Reticulomyxa filosa]
TKEFPAFDVKHIRPKHKELKRSIRIDSAADIPYIALRVALDTISTFYESSRHHDTGSKLFVETMGRVSLDIILNFDEMFLYSLKPDIRRVYKHRFIMAVQILRKLLGFECSSHNSYLLDEQIWPSITSTIFNRFLDRLNACAPNVNENRLCSALTDRLNLLMEHLHGSGVPLNLYDSVKLRVSISMMPTVFDKRINCLQSSLRRMSAKDEHDNKRIDIGNGKQRLQRPLFANYFAQWIQKVLKMSESEFVKNPSFEHFELLLNRQLILPNVDEKSPESQSVKDNELLIAVSHHNLLATKLTLFSWQRLCVIQILRGNGAVICDSLLYFMRHPCEELDVTQYSCTLNNVIEDCLKRVIKSIMVAHYPKMFESNWSAFVQAWYKKNGGWGKAVELTFVSYFLNKLLECMQEMTNKESACYSTLCFYSAVVQLWNNLCYAFRMVFMDDLHKWVKVFVQALQQVQHQHTFSKYARRLFNITVVWNLIEKVVNLPEFVMPVSLVNLKKKPSLAPRRGQFPYLILVEAAETSHQFKKKKYIYAYILWVDLAWKWFCKEPYQSILSLYDKNESEALNNCVDRVIRLFELFVATQKDAFSWDCFTSVTLKLLHKEGPKSERNVVTAVLEAVVRHVLTSSREKRKDESDHSFLFRAVCNKSFFFFSNHLYYHREFIMWNLIQKDQVLLFVEQCYNKGGADQLFAESAEFGLLLLSFHKTCSSSVDEIDARVKQLVFPIVESYVTNASKKTSELTPLEDLSRRIMQYLLNFTSPLSHKLSEDKRLPLAKSIIEIHDMDKQLENSHVKKWSSGFVKKFYADKTSSVNQLVNLLRPVERTLTRSVQQEHSKVAEESMTLTIVHVLKSVLGRRTWTDLLTFFEKDPVTSIEEDALLVWCTNATFFKTFCALVRYRVDWKALFEWLVIVGEKKLRVKEMIEFGKSLTNNMAPNYLQTKEISVEVQEWINVLTHVASSPTQNPLLRSFVANILQKLMSDVDFVVATFGATHIWTLVRSLFYCYHIGAHVSYQPVRDKLITFIDGVRQVEEHALRQDRSDVLKKSLRDDNDNTNQIGDITKLLFQNLVNLEKVFEVDAVNNEGNCTANLLKGCLEASFAFIQSNPGLYCHLSTEICILCLNTLTFIGRYPFHWDIKSDLQTCARLFSLCQIQ